MILDIGFSDFLSIWSNSGWIFKLVFILVSVFILGVIIKPQIDSGFKLFDDIYRAIKLIFKKKDLNDKNITPGIKTKEEIKDDVNNHDLMLVMNQIEMKFDTLNFGDRKRNKIFKLILRTQIESIKKNINDLIRDYDIDQLSKNEFGIVVTKTLVNISNDTDTKLKAELGFDIYDLIMNSKRGMKSWSKFNVTQTHELINTICKEDYIEYNHIRLYFVMVSLSTSLSITYNGLEQRFSKFNGELTNLIKKW